MPLNPDKNLKIYYSIKEVAEQVGVNESTLRFWEKEFPRIRPKTTAQGVRQYTEKDIEQIKVIYNLIKVRGFKIAAARKYLAANKEDAEKKTVIIEKLTNLRNELKDMKDRLNSLT